MRRVLYAERLATHWVRRVISPGAVSISRTIDFFRSTVPSKSVTTSSSFSLAFASSEHLRFLSPLDAFRRELRLPGFSALLATSPARSHVVCDGAHRHRFVTSSGFRSLSTSCSALGLAGLFHPAATSRVLPFKGFSPRAATLPLRKELPPCRCSAARSPTLVGCRTRRTSASRSSSARGRVHDSTVIHRAARRSPLRVRLLQALTSPVDRSLPAISALDVSSLAPSLFAIALRARPQRLSRRSPASRLRFACLLELSSLLPNLRARDSALIARCQAMRSVREARHSRSCPRDLRLLPERASRFRFDARVSMDVLHACSISAR
jgi:hypothetical protein